KPKGRLAAGISEPGKNVCGGLMRSVFISYTSKLCHLRCSFIILWLAYASFLFNLFLLFFHP
ncbi:hypothetical protein MUO71_07345, partial [Candidatus Bathyarchaeota archaeon]|nr:hypothetical protein [Candidatus Bathyarchaeota archaeon]